MLAFVFRTEPPLRLAPLLLRPLHNLATAHRRFCHDRVDAVACLRALHVLGDAYCVCAMAPRPSCVLKQMYIHVVAVQRGACNRLKNVVVKTTCHTHAKVTTATAIQHQAGG